MFIKAWAWDVTNTKYLPDLIKKDSAWTMVAVTAIVSVERQLSPNALPGTLIGAGAVYFVPREANKVLEEIQSKYRELLTK